MPHVLDVTFHISLDLKFEILCTQLMVIAHCGLSCTIHMARYRVLF